MHHRFICVQGILQLGTAESLMRVKRSRPHPDNHPIPRQPPNTQISTQEKKREIKREREREREKERERKRDIISVCP